MEFLLVFWQTLQPCLLVSPPPTSHSFPSPANAKSRFRKSQWAGERLLYFSENFEEKIQRSVEISSYIFLPFSLGLFPTSALHVFVCVRLFRKKKPPLFCSPSSPISWARVNEEESRCGRLRKLEEEEEEFPVPSLFCVFAFRQAQMPMPPPPPFRARPPIPSSLTSSSFSKIYEPGEKCRLPPPICTKRSSHVFSLWGRKERFWSFREPQIATCSGLVAPISDYDKSADLFPRPHYLSVKRTWGTLCGSKLFVGSVL